MPVPMHPVKSSNLSYIGWQDNILYITFNNGKKYKYNNVARLVFNNLKQSSSAGKYFNSNIKNIFEAEEI